MTSCSGVFIKQRCLVWIKSITKSCYFENEANSNAHEDNADGAYKSDENKDRSIRSKIFIVLEANMYFNMYFNMNKPNKVLQFRFFS